MITRLAASICPSDTGWNEVVMCSLAPDKRISSRQKVDMKTGSRSDDTIDCGTRAGGPPQ